MMRTQIANIITGCRIICSILLLFFPAFSVGFYITYLLCGFSDMTDGAVARKTNSHSSFGAKFDTVADFVFLFLAWYKLLPAMHIPQWLRIWIIIIAAIKSGNIIWGLFRRKTLVSVHNVLNKVTGFALFLFPFTIPFAEPIYGLAILCGLATVSAVREGYMIRTGRDVVL